MTLRDALRTDLRPEHDRLDAAMAGLDLTTARDLGAFFQIHWTVWRCIIPDGHDARQDLDATCHALERDLHTLGVSPPDIAAPCHVDARAALYMIHGSRAGTAMLRRGWRAATQPDIRAACAFFDLPQDRRRWTDLCDHLSHIAPDSAAGQDILRDTARIYALFLSAAHKQWP